MGNIKNGYLSVSLNIQPEGFDISCWMSTVDVWQKEEVFFPCKYTYMGEFCTWIIHSSSELTPKMVVMVGEQADRICIEQADRNNRRKVANR